MNGELVTTGPSSGSLALRADQQEWTPTQAAALAQIGVADAPAGDQAVFLHVCQRTGLDPFSRQIYMIGRKERGRDGEPDKVKWTIQTGIDGFRVIAERHPQYAGQLAPEWCGDDGVWRDFWPDRGKPPTAARVGVLRHDWTQPIYATVHFEEFAAYFPGGRTLLPMWKAKGVHMIGKVAEAHSLRKGFPLDLAGLYTDDEMQHVDHPGHRTERGVVLDVDGTPAGEARVSTPDLIGPQTAPDPATDRMRPAQQHRLFKLLREVDAVDDRWAWASAQLGREVRTWAAVTVTDADALIAALERAAVLTATTSPTEQETPTP